MVKISICDGSCLFNPGPGGWCYATVSNEQVEFVYGSEEKTTNNRMELRAVIEFLQNRGSTSSISDLIYTDSRYVVDGISKWIHSWKRNGWKNAKKEAVKNEDLWKMLDEKAKNTEFRWMKGHDTPVEVVLGTVINAKDVETKNDSNELDNNLLIRIQNQVDVFARKAAESRLNGSTCIELKYLM